MNYFMTPRREPASSSDKIKPFKLWFVSPKVLGKSDIEVGKPLRLPPITTPKCYNKYDVDKINVTPEEIERCLKLLEIKSPREKYKRPVTENLKYGWWAHVRLSDTDKSDRRLYFGKHTNPLIREHLMNYAKIR